MRTESLQRVGTAGRLKPASRRDQRADQTPVHDNWRHEHPCRRRRNGCRLLYCPRAHRRCSAPTCRRSSRPRTRSRSAARSAWHAVAAAGFARTTRRLPAGSESRCSRTKTRSRRFTRLRTTAVPTARLTIKPTFADSSGRTPGQGTAIPESGESGTTRCPVIAGRPARRPSRTARRKSAGRFIRACRGSICGTPASARTKASGAQLVAALAAARGQNRAARPGTHPQPEAMGLRPPAVVRLERTLAHWSSR